MNVSGKGKTNKYWKQVGSKMLILSDLTQIKQRRKGKTIMSVNTYFSFQLTAYSLLIFSAAAGPRAWLHLQCNSCTHRSLHQPVMFLCIHTLQPAHSQLLLSSTQGNRGSSEERISHCISPRITGRKCELLSWLGNKSNHSRSTAQEVQM